MIEKLTKFYSIYNLTLSQGDNQKAAKMLSDFVEEVSKMMLIHKEFTHYNNQEYARFLKQLREGEIISGQASMVIFWAMTGGNRFNLRESDITHIVKENGGFMFGNQIAVGTGIINLTRYNYEHLNNMIPATYDSVKVYMKKRKSVFFVIDSGMDFDMFSEMLFITNKEKDLDLRKRIYLKTANGLRKFDSLN
jgi:hypothetical protein